MMCPDDNRPVFFIGLAWALVLDLAIIALLWMVFAGLF